MLIVVDEAYREFDEDPTSPDGLEFALARANVLTLRTMSKAYGLAGLRVGYAVGDPHVITALRKVAIPFALSTVGQAAGLAALAAKDELAPRWQQVIEERKRVTGELRDFGFEVPTSQANFVWLPLRERAAEFAAHAEKHKVIVRAFPDAAGGVRVTIGSPAENDELLNAAAGIRTSRQAPARTDAVDRTAPDRQLGFRGRRTVQRNIRSGGRLHAVASQRHALVTTCRHRGRFPHTGCVWVLHVDMDQFIAAVELLRHPELAGLPVVVGGAGDPTQRSVVATASYAAREFGIRSGMPMRFALRKCPNAIFLPADNPAYEQASAEILEVLRSFDVVVEVLGWDEWFLGPENDAADQDNPEAARRAGSRPQSLPRPACTVRSGSATTPCAPSSPPNSANRPVSSG